MEAPPLGPGGEDITWPDQVAPRGRKASSTRKIEPQTSNPMCRNPVAMSIASEVLLHVPSMALVLYWDVLVTDDWSLHPPKLPHTA